MDDESPKPRFGHGPVARRILFGLIGILVLVVVAFLADFRVDGKFIGLSEWEEVSFTCDESDLTQEMSRGWQIEFGVLDPGGGSGYGMLGDAPPPIQTSWAISPREERRFWIFAKRRRFRRILTLDSRPDADARVEKTEHSETRWYEFGVMDYHREYLEGVPHGEWIDNFIDGRPREILHFDRGTPHGVLERWWPNGKRWERRTLYKGRVHGTWTRWHENGKVFAQGEFENGTGSLIYRDLLGTVLGIRRYREGEPVDGPWCEWYETGQPWIRGAYRDGLRQGEWTVYWSSGEVSAKGSYRNGRREGPWEFRSAPPENRVWSTGSYLDGKPEGRWRFPRGSGEIVGEYRDGLAEGVWQHEGEDAEWSDGPWRFEAGKLIEEKESLDRVGR